MKQAIFSVIKSLYGSFNNSPNGASARKLSAFIAVVTAIVMTFAYCNADVLANTLTIWLLFALFNLGLVSFEQIIMLKNRDTSKDVDPYKPTE